MPDDREPLTGRELRLMWIVALVLLLGVALGAAIAIIAMSIGLRM